MSETNTEGFDALLDVARHSLRNAAPLPAQVELRTYWSGVGFELFGRRLVVALEEVVETLEMPKLTRLPGVKPWVLGVANVRGRLLPVTDLAAMLGGERKRNGRRRVMVVERGELLAGLLVDDVFGIQHFPDEDRREVSEKPADLEPYLVGEFSSETHTWLACSMDKLISDSHFMMASSHHMIENN